MFYCLLEREGEGNINVTSLYEWEWNPQPRHVPSPELNPPPFGVQNSDPINLATQPGPGPKFLFPQFIMGYLFFRATSSSGLGTICAVSFAPHLGSCVHLDVHNDQRIHI